MFQPLCTYSSSEHEITLAVGNAPSHAWRSVPPRSIQSRLTITSASRIACVAAPVTYRLGGNGWRGCARRKARAGLDVGQHDRAVRSASATRRVEVARVVRHAADHEQRPRGVVEQRRDACAPPPADGDALLRRRKALERGHRHRCGERLLLQSRIERDVRRPARLRHRDAVRAHDRLERRRHRARQVVPLDVAADERAKVARRVDPVHPRATLASRRAARRRRPSGSARGRTTR